MGGKARSLQQLASAGFRVPPFFVVRPDDALDAEALRWKCAALAPGNADARFAVRSSAEAEDGATASYAGMFDTFLFVDTASVVDRIERVRASASSERIAAYESRNSRTSPHQTSAIVQVMIDAEVSGVAFGRDPIDGGDRVVIASAFGMGTGVVGGDCDTDTFRVDRDGHIVECTIAHKTLAHRRSDTLDGTASVAVDPAQTDEPSLCAARIQELAETVRAIGETFGAPQDVEWALHKRRLYILQARPVTTPAGTMWDNSNISESYGGIVQPLTFSFVQYAYAGAYRQLMRALAIPEARVALHNDQLENMLGLVEGRMYYNLMNWYKLLALMPGFRLNRRFMETMMGVSESPSDGALRQIEEGGKAGDAIALAATLWSLARHHVTLARDIRRFHALIERTLASSPALETCDLSALDAEYARLEQCLLTTWEAPLVNDFFAMVFYGLLRSLCAKWCDDYDGSIHNDLLCAGGGMISTQPALQMSQLADLAGSTPHLLDVFESGDAAAARSAIARYPQFAAAFDSYISTFGDRCMSELKLESITLHDDPLPLLRGIARLARGDRPATDTTRSAHNARAAAEQRAVKALRSTPIRAAAFAFVLANARRRVRDRENLRFERTRVFARVRRIFAQVGARLHSEGYLESPRDIFSLEIGDVRNAMAQPALRAGLAAKVADSAARYATFAAQSPPPDRFTSIGNTAPTTLANVVAGDPRERIGLGCCPGVVRARVRVVADPSAPLQRGEILVAERTDPGWIVLFPAAAGILVERGSMLSHAAIVSREMGIPSVVALPGLTAWLHDGDLVEFDGRSGRVSLLERAAEFRNPTDARPHTAQIA